MTQPSTPPILSELRNASSPATQIKALRDLKNEIIGHEEKKRHWIGLGIVSPLVRILNSHRGTGKKKHRELNGSTSPLKPRSIRSEEEDARLQAIIIIGSLASGGPSFLAPLHNGLVISPLLSLLSPVESHPLVIIQALRALNAVADTSQLSSPIQIHHEASLQNLLYTQQSLSNVASLLQQSPITSIVRQQIDLSASILCKTCYTEHHRALLAQSGVLEALASKIAPAIVDTCSDPRDTYEPSSSLEGGQVAPPRLSLLLKAVSLVIKGSKPRAAQFLAAPVFGSAFAAIGSHLEHDPAFVIAQNGLQRKSTAVQITLKALESLTPQIPTTSSRSGSASLPQHGPVGSAGVHSRAGHLPQSLSTAIELFHGQGLEYVGDDESPLVPWLIYLFRSQDPVTSLIAAEILVILGRLGLIRRLKDSAFALLLVPSLVRMLEKDPLTLGRSDSHYSSFTACGEKDLVKEEAPAVLAMLTSNNSETQKAAADAGAIKKLSQLLKESFDPLPIDSSSSLWTPDAIPDEPFQATDSSSRLGESGVSAAAYHILRLRESILAALAAIASDKDEYRKEIIDNGVIPFIVKTLKAEPVEASGGVLSNRPSDAESEGRMTLQWNYRDAVLAACGAARALSRSVSTLRTSLMDAGLAAPLFTLLKSQDTDVQVAATAVVCNLVLKFSPMREAIMNGGILDLMCDHAHDQNAKLRLNSLWALKHVIAGASNPVKITCLEKLSPGWLVQVLASEIEPSSPMTGGRFASHDDGGTTPIRMSTPNAAGEQVDLLNAVVEASKGSNQLLDDDADEDSKMSDSIGALGARHDRDTHPHSKQPMPNIMEGHEGLFFNITTSSHSHKTLSDEVAIQKEALEIIRNLLCGEASPQMIDHLFREMGQDKFFELLATKLRPRILNAFNRDRRSMENGLRQIQPQTEIVVSVCYTIVHIAAGQPRHRQLLVSQTDLLKLLVPLFHHQSREVRSCCAWFVINLTWVEDSSDRHGAKLRARELAKLGFLEKLEGLENNDENLDCKERAKTARDQMRQLLHS